MRLPSGRSTITAVLVVFCGGVLAFVVLANRRRRTRIDPDQTLKQAIAYSLRGVPPR